MAVRTVHIRVDKPASEILRVIEDMHLGAIGNIMMTKESFEEKYV